MQKYLYKYVQYIFMGKSVDIVLPSGKRLNIHISNNPEIRKQQAQRLSKRYNYDFSPNLLSSIARKERKYDTQRQKQKQATKQIVKKQKQKRPSWARNIKNWERLSSSVRQKLARQRGQTSLRSKKDLFVIDRKGTLATSKAISGLKKTEDKRYKVQRLKAISSVQADLKKRFGQRFAKSKTKQKTTRKKTGFERRVEKIQKREEGISKRMQRLDDTFNITNWVGRRKTKAGQYAQDFASEALTLPTKFTIGAIDYLELVGRKIAATGEGLVTSRKQTLKELKRAAKETPKEVASAFDVRDPATAAQLTGIVLGGGKLVRSKPTVKIKPIKVKKSTKTKTKKTNKIKTKAKKIKTKAKRYLKERAATRIDILKKVYDAKVKPKKLTSIQIRNLTKKRLTQARKARKPSRQKTLAKANRKAQRKEFTKKAREDIKKARTARQREKRKAFSRIKRLRQKPVTKNLRRTPKAVRPNQTKFWLEDVDGNVFGSVRTFKDWRKSQIELLRQTGELPKRKGMSTRAKRILKQNIGKKAQSKLMLQKATLKRPKIRKDPTTPKLKTRAKSIELKPVNRIAKSTRRGRRIRPFVLNVPELNQAGAIAIKQTPSQTLKGKSISKQKINQGTATQQTPEQKATTKSKLRQTVGVVTVGALATAAAQRIRRGKKPIKGRQSSQRADFLFRKSVFSAKRSKKGIYLPDLYAVYTGERATRKQAAKLVNPNTYLSGFEARPIIG